jgi:hypothetical protein
VSLRRKQRPGDVPGTRLRHPVGILLLVDDLPNQKLAQDVEAGRLETGAILDLGLGKKISHA